MTIFCKILSTQEFLTAECPYTYSTALQITINAFVHVENKTREKKHHFNGNAVSGGHTAVRYLR